MYWHAFAALSMLAGLLAFSLPKPAIAAPSGFDPGLVNDEYVVGDLFGSGPARGAVSADWLPDGRMIVLTREGLLWLVNVSQGSKTLLHTMSDVDPEGESGAMDFVVAPDFASSRTVYVYYSALSDYRLRIGKFTFDASLSWVASQSTVWSNPGPSRVQFSYPSYHMGGSLDIGPDGKFYLSIGDAQGQQSQDLSNVFGKVLRINLNGTVPGDNPGLSASIPEIWAYGLRNPFRAGFERTRTAGNPLGTVSSAYWAGDVGGNVAETAYEEVNLIEAGKNYGWPLCEGPTGANGNPLHVTCPGGITGPVFSYPHAVGVECCFNKAIIGGQVYHGGPFPLSGYYIFGDYPSQTISWLQLGADGRSAVDSGTLIDLPGSTPGWIDVGPDGYIYYLDLYSSALRRLTYPAGANTPPVITTASASPKSGPAPLSVQFTGAASDPQGDGVSYSWNFGDGQSSASPSPSHVYTVAGTYQARLTVTAGGQSASSNPIAISAGSPPVPTIHGVADGSLFVVGQTISATGTATDVNEGTLPGSRLTWKVEFVHDNHLHPVTNGVGPSVSFTIGDAGHDYSGNTGYKITLTATNAVGLSAATSVTVRPTKIAVAVTANVPTTAVISGITQALPFAIDTIATFRHTIEVPDVVCSGAEMYRFQSWSDGGARIHTVTASAGLAVAATYQPTGGRCDSRYVPLPAQRVYDSRSGAKPQGGAVLSIPMLGQGGVPRSGVTSVAVNVTAVEAGGDGFVTVWPGGTEMPNASNLNLRTGETAPNLVTVSPGFGGTISIMTTTTAHLLVDVFGYYAPATTATDGRFVPLSSPRRIFDTRNTETTPAAGSIRTVNIPGSLGIGEDTASAAVLNVTAVGSLAPGFVTVWESDTGLPNVSNINLDHVGQTRPNQVIVKLGAGGGISLYTSSGAHLLVDVVGYFTTSSAPASTSGLFVPTKPSRILDTRGGSRAAAGSRVDVGVSGSGGIPSAGVLAVVANATAVHAGGAGFVTAFPGGQGVPNISTLNVEFGQTIPNHSTTMVAGGSISLQSTVDADLLLDVAGWYTS